jgi:adenosylcobinamide-phosphate synthase
VSGADAPAAVLAGALVIDLALGDPPNRWHPVAWLGALIAAARRRLAQGSPPALLMKGGVVTLGVAVVAGLGGVFVVRLAARLGVAGIALEAVALSCCLSIRGLWRAAGEVADCLERGDVAGARTAVGFHLVSRPTLELDPGEVAAAAVESVAENLTDSVLAPALMYLVFGLPGAALYRAVNTADAMLGYREGVLEHFGKLAARLDDALNLIPARIGGVALVLAAALTGASPARAWSTMWRDRRRTASPNAGWTMAAMAGALGVRLVKRGAYVLGDGALPTPRDIRRGLVVMAVAALVVIVPALVVVFFRSMRAAPVS